VSPGDRLPSYDAVFLSPHLDDAALSCGGQIADRVLEGQSVLIVTVFAGDGPSARRSPLARKIERGWNLGDDGMEKRRAEDEEACGLLGAACEHWSFQDAIHRRDPASGGPVYDTLPELLSPPKPVDEPLVERIAARLDTLAPFGTLFAPLAVGGHADHFLTRWAAEEAVDPEHLVYYEDYPYSRRTRAVEHALEGEGIGAAWRPERVPVSAAAFRKRTRAVLAHRSQLWPLFKGGLAARFSLWWWWRTAGGERIWRREREER
jgi:LmbE family N-acetylglucosaminyl deacetylase